MHNTDDLQKLLEILPQDIQQQLYQHPQCDRLVEVVLDLGRRPEARFPDGAEYLSEQPVTHVDLQLVTQTVGHFGGDNRAGIEQTLHRISAIRNRTGEIIGLTCRVGRAIFGTIAMIRDLVETGQSILMLGRPGVGKTTALREIARVLADDLNKRVVIIDSSNEIAGDGDIPHPAIGRARRMQVARPELQHQVMIEAVENHMPEVIVIDEIGTELEALAARTIAERGVQLVGTAHGNQLENLIKNPTLSDLVGGIQSVTLGDDEARRRGSQKSVLERKAPPTFEIAVEMQERQKWTVHDSVADTVDALLRGRQPSPQIRAINEQGQIEIIRQVAPGAPRRPMSTPMSQTNGRSLSSLPQRQVAPFPQPQHRYETWMERDSSSVNELEASFSPNDFSPNDKGQNLLVYPYGFNRHEVEAVIQKLNLPIKLAREIDGADAILALRAQVRKHTNLQRMARSRQIPIEVVKTNTPGQLARTLQHLVGIDDPEVEAQFERKSVHDEHWDALQEAQLAVEQVVLPKRQPVELLPRPAEIRKMQHELVEHYRLRSSSFGEEPNRRLRIYPK